MSRVARLAALLTGAAALHGCGEASLPTTASAPVPAAEASVSAQATPPRILSMRWDSVGIPTAEDCPLPFELATVDCRAVDDDGDAATLTLTLESIGSATLSPRYPARIVTSFPATRMPGGTTHVGKATFLLVTPGPDPSVRATCEVVDARGLRDVRTRTCGYR